MFRFSAARRAGGALKPKWTIDKTHMYTPAVTVRDGSYTLDHATYTGFTLWLRGVRPYVEKIFQDVFQTAKCTAKCVYDPVTKFITKHNPDVRLQLIAFASFWMTASYVASYFSDYYQQIMDIRHYLHLRRAKQLDSVGFWDSHSEDAESHAQAYFEDSQRLQNLWETAISDASLDRSFETLCKYLHVDESEVPAAVPSQIKWRFNMMPYGQDNPHTQTFPTPGHEKPLKAFALNFTYNNLAADWGDYINRKDNKAALMRPARPMFTDVYIPGTK